MGVLLLSPADAHNLELSSGPQPYRRAVFLRIEDGDAARQYLVWYDAAQQLLYDLAYFYRQEGVKISSCLQLNLLEQPATYRVRHAKREPDTAYAADLEVMQAARRGYDFTPANAPADQVIGLRRAIELRVDDLEQRVGNLQRLVAQLGSDEARR